MPIAPTDETAYLKAVMREFRRDTGLHKGYELRRRLWRSAVVVCEITPDGYRDWHLKLAELAYKAGLGEREVVTTILSARRKAGV
jgi:hypothetical protein